MFVTGDVLLRKIIIFALKRFYCKKRLVGFVWGCGCLLRLVLYSGNWNLKEAVIMLALFSRTIHC